MSANRFRNALWIELHPPTTLQEYLIALPVLYRLRRQRTCSFGIDTCDHQTCFVLLQHKPDEPKKVVGYWSKSFNDVKYAYDIPYEAFLAVGQGVLLLGPYLNIAQTKLRTDHDLWPRIFAKHMHQASSCVGTLNRREWALVLSSSRH